MFTALVVHGISRTIESINNRIRDRLYSYNGLVWYVLSGRHSPRIWQSYCTFVHLVTICQTWLLQVGKGTLVLVNGGLKLGYARSRSDGVIK